MKKKHLLGVILFFCVVLATIIFALDRIHCFKIHINYGNGQDGTEETQEDLTPDAGSKSDGTAAETKTAVPGQNTGEKESAK